MDFMELYKSFLLYFVLYRECKSFVTYIFMMLIPDKIWLIKLNLWRSS